MARKEKERKNHLIHYGEVNWHPEVVEVGEGFWLLKVVNRAQFFSALTCYDVAVYSFEKDASCELSVSLLGEPYANPGEAVMLRVEARDEESVRAAQDPLTLGLRIQGDYAGAQTHSWLGISLPPLRGEHLG